MINLFQAIILGSLQGITELFPISSLGHSVILPSLFGWQINQDSPSFIALLVATHTATCLVLFLFFYKDWLKIIEGFIRSLKRREIRDEDRDAKIAWSLIAATIPAGFLGLLFQSKLEKLFASPILVAFVLILNGLLLLAGDYLRKKATEKVVTLTWGKSIIIGLMQCLALIPGFSRTGSTLTGGLLSGLTYEDSAKFSFLLATPIIAAATVLKFSEIIKAGNFEVNLIGGFFAGLFAYLSVKFLTKYFETKKLLPFAIYCIAAGIIFSLILH